MKRFKMRNEDPFAGDGIVSEHLSQGIAMGMSLGICFGVAMGVAFGNVGVGISLGLSMGVSLGAVLGYAIGEGKKAKKPQLRSKNRRLFVTTGNQIKKEGS